MNKILKKLERNVTILCVASIAVFAIWCAASIIVFVIGLPPIKALEDTGAWMIIGGGFSILSGMIALMWINILEYIEFGKRDEK